MTARDGRWWNARSLLVCSTMFHGAVSGMAAQTVAGTVWEDAVGGVPVAGAFISLVADGGETIAQGFTSQTGTFLLTAPHGGEFRTKVERIGYRAWLSELYTLGSNERRESAIVVAREPVLLAPLQVKLTRPCYDDLGDAATLANVWEEVRKALEMAAWVERQDEIRFSLAEYERLLDPRDLSLQEVTRRDRRNVGLPPFESQSPRELLEAGYAAFRADTSAFFAPDANVLLSEEFKTAHCFGLRTAVGEGDEPLLGVTFRPRPSRGVPEIEGVLWVSRATAELRRVVFQYVNVPLWRGVERRHLGGELRFDRLPNGPFFISDWWIRLPVRGKVYVNLPGADRERAVLAAYKEVGGSAMEVLVDGRQVVNRLGPSVHGVVRSSSGTRGVEGARVVLRDWEAAARFARRDDVREGMLSAITDTAGRFEVRGLRKGTWVLEVTEPMAAGLGVPPIQRTLHVTEGEIQPVEVLSRSLDDMYAAICPASPLHRQEGAIVGVVREATSGEPVAGVAVEARWVAQRISVSPAGMVLVADEARYVEEVADGQGRFCFCGLPAGEAILVRESGTELGESIMLDRRIARRDIYLGRR